MSELPNCVAEEQRQFAEDTIDKLNEDYASWDASWGREEHFCPWCDNSVDTENPATEEYCDDYFCNLECLDNYSRSMK